MLSTFYRKCLKRSWILLHVYNNNFFYQISWICLDGYNPLFSTTSIVQNIEVTLRFRILLFNEGGFWFLSDAGL